MRSKHCSALTFSEPSRGFFGFRAVNHGRPVHGIKLEAGTRVGRTEEGLNPCLKFWNLCSISFSSCACFTGLLACFSNKDYATRARQLHLHRTSGSLKLWQVATKRPGAIQSLGRFRSHTHQLPISKARLSFALITVKKPQQIRRNGYRENLQAQRNSEVSPPRIQ